MLLASRGRLEHGKLSNSSVEEQDSMTIINRAVGVASLGRGGDWSSSARSEGPRQANTMTDVIGAVRAASPSRHFDGRQPGS